MDRIGTIKIEMHLVSLKSIVPIVPKDEGEKQQLMEDLIWIGCEGQLLQLWSKEGRGDLPVEGIEERRPGPDLESYWKSGRLSEQGLRV